MKYNLEELRTKYNMLREAGFSAKEASALKSSSFDRVERLCEMSMKYIRQMSAVMKERDQALKKELKL